MSLYVLGMMPFVVLVLGIVVSLIVIGGIADANQQARRLRSLGTDQNATGGRNGKPKFSEEKIIKFADRRRVRG